MTRRKVFAALVAVGATAILAAVTGFTSKQNAFSGTIYFGMDAPLTGPTELVGQSDRQTVQAVVAYWNARGGIKGRRVVVDVLDNASNPSQAVQNVQKFIGDSKYVGILGSGNAAAAVATGPLASQAGIPFLALSPPTTLVAPPIPYVYVASPTARLYAYNEAAYLRKLKISKVWLMGDNGGFGRDGPAQVAKLASAYGHPGRGHDDLLARDDRLHRRADEGEELRSPGAVAVDGDAGRVDDREAVPAASAARSGSC